MSTITHFGEFVLIIDYSLLIIATVIINDAEASMSKPLFVWQNKELKKVNPEDVICLSTEGNYTRIYLANNTFYLVRCSLSTALKKLPSDMFIRIHRSFVASVCHVRSIRNDYLVVRSEALPIGKQYYESLLAKLNIIE